MPLHRQMIPSFVALMTIFVLSACGSGSGGAGSGHPFQGQWLDEDILQFRSSGDEQFICDRIEKLNENYEMTIDGYDIDSNGNVRDFSLYRNQNSVDQQEVGSTSILNRSMWKVHPDGTTYDNQLVANKETVEGADNVIGNVMRKINDDRITNTWIIQGEQGKEIQSTLVYVKTNSEEIETLKKIVEACPKK